MIRAVAFALALLPAPLVAHEFWIDPTDFTVPAGAPIVADLRVGEEMKGSAHSFIEPNFRRFDIVQNGRVIEVEGRTGDRPALNMAAPADGLAVIVHVTTDSRLTYKELAKFEKFARHKAFEGAIARHKARGLPDSGFTERYARYAKSLVAVGSGTGSDREVGLETEIVALANPYTDALNGQMPVRVLADGRPRANAQVELFERAPDGAVKVTLHRTDGSGRAMLPVKAGHAYLADAVVLEELDPDASGGAAWRTLWASLTFAVE